MIRFALVPPAAAFVIGTLVPLPLAADVKIVVLAALSFLCGSALFIHTDGTRIRALIAVALVLGALNSFVRNDVHDRTVKIHIQNVSGLVDGDVQAASWGSSFPLKLDNGGTVSASVAGNAPMPGMHLRIRGHIEPFDEARNPLEPATAELARERGFDARLAKGRIVGVLPSKPGDVHSIFARARLILSQRLHASLGEPYASILAGEMWGERSTLPPDLRAEFQDTGTVHILVTAGLHLGVIAMVSLWILAMLEVPRSPTCLCVAVLVWVYVLFSGSHLPSMRAATMITFALGARAYGAKALSWNALAAAAITVAGFWPTAVTSASFSLSFSCVGSIILLGPHIDAVLERYDALPSKVREALTLTIATQAGVWPLTAATFMLFSPYAIVANFAVVPCVGVTIILGFAQLSFDGIPIVGHAVANLNEWLLSYVVAVVRFTSGLPNAHVVMTPPPTWTIAFYDLVLFCSVWLFTRRQYYIAAVLFAAAVALIVLPPRLLHHELRVTILDVGQADGIVIQTPSGHAFLVDAGGRLERGAPTPGQSMAEAVGERVVVPFLIRHGIHHLDGIFISHPHGDHAGGVAPVLRTLSDDAILDSGQAYRGFAYRDAMEVAHALNIKNFQPRAGNLFTTDDNVKFEFLGPSLPFLTGTRNDINNNSLVFMLQYKSFRMLFTGDAGSESEQQILNQGVDLHADVLKVGHHGSAYSSTTAFIEAVHPKYAIISVGRYNLFGHPAPQTILTLRSVGARVYRTDQDCAISIASDGDDPAVSPMCP
ncbi:MAG: DNA internalization-related competence protein ComEC/Rec2 [Candidatus Eremiobacteraeota bacterium]|nr:DNA internalization-related competence protein ComEC/Rec2 [Candidatus Eremiobacteraeota bacterium]